jgi:hypothetical protein
MSKTRFEIALPSERREALEELAAEVGVSAPDLARVGIGWVLARRDLLICGEMKDARWPS